MNQQTILGFVSELEEMLLPKANFIKAPKYEAYMKNKFSFLGVVAPLRNEIQKKLFPTWKKIAKSLDRWDLVIELWQKEEREYQYVAVDWICSWKDFFKEDESHMTRLIVSKSWWDSVDKFSSSFVGNWAMKYTDLSKELFADWLESDNIWLQRSVLIYQLKYKTSMDLVYLESVIHVLKKDPTFFIQKAIGWSLRQASKFFPQETKTIINRQNLKGIALKEACKYLN